MKTAEEITAALEALKTQAETAVAAGLEAAEAKALLHGDGTDDNPGLLKQVETLTREKEEADKVAEGKALTAQIESLTSVVSTLVENARKPSGDFQLPVADGGIFATATSDDEEGKALGSYGAISRSSRIKGERGFSVFADIKLANRGNQDAVKRLTEGYGETWIADTDGKAVNPEGKALTEGVQAQGGYLVRPQIERQIVLARELDNVIRPLCSSINVETNAIQLDQLGITTAAGWTAELGTKPEATGMTLASLTANVYTAAGLATVSNQLLADSNPAIDQLATADLAKRLVALEESAFLNGSGVNQPLGILNTPGIGATALTATDIVSLLNAVLTSIAAVELAHGAPNAIVMHPKTWTRILLAVDAQGAYYIDPAGGPQDPRTGIRGPIKTLWGYPVITSNRVPTNLGGGTNESRVIVGDFQEALILDRQGITVDESAHVLFTTNQTIFRVEERVGFTAARTPLAFTVVGGVGLANG